MVPSVCSWNKELWIGKQFLLETFYDSFDSNSSKIPRGTGIAIHRNQNRSSKSNSELSKKDETRLRNCCGNVPIPALNYTTGIGTPPAYYDFRFTHCNLIISSVRYVSCTVISEKRFTRFLSIALACCASLPFWLAAAMAEYVRWWRDRNLVNLFSEMTVWFYLRPHTSQYPLGSAKLCSCHQCLGK